MPEPSPNENAAAAPPSPDISPADARRAFYLSFLVAGAFFMENLDGTVIATAIPQMAKSFGVPPVDLGTGITAYLLTLAVFIPISGWVADRWGARTVFATAIGVFTAASVLCGLCHGLAPFILARILQGIGGAMMVPVGRLVVLRNTQKADLMRAIAYIMWPGLAAPVIGPPVGGFIVLHASWRWIFYLNVPLGLIALALTFLLVPNLKETSRRPFDVPGFLLSGAACVCLLYGLEQIGGGAGGSANAWAPCVAALAASVGFGYFAVRHLRNTPHPLFDLSSLGTKTFSITIWGGSLFRIAIGSLPFLLPLLFQVGFGLNPAAAGLLVLWVFAGNLGMKPATTPVIRRFGFRTTLIGNGLLAAATVFACAALSPQTPPVVIVVVLFAGGLCRSMQFTGMNTMGFADIPKDRMSGANALYSTVGQLTFGMGIAFGAVALRLGALLRGASPGSPPILSDFRLAFCLAGIFALLSVADCWGLAHDAGEEVSGRRKRAA